MKTYWYIPFNTVGFVPATPGGELARTLQGIVDEETERLKMKAKIVETGGRCIKSKLVKMDLTGCSYDDCYLYTS